MGCCNVVAVLSMADMVCLDYAETVQCMSNAGSVWYKLEFKLCCEVLLLLNMADMGCLLCVRLWCEQS